MTAPAKCPSCGSAKVLAGIFGSGKCLTCHAEWSIAGPKNGTLYPPGSQYGPPQPRPSAAYQAVRNDEKLAPKEPNLTEREGPSAEPREFWLTNYDPRLPKMAFSSFEAASAKGWTMEHLIRVREVKE